MSNIPDDALSRKAESLRNAENSFSGKSFEKLISKSCTEYKEQGLACIEKVPEPFVVLEPLGGGLFKGRFTAAKAQPDFQGTLQGGRAIVIEAKYTSTEHLGYAVLTEHQQELLEFHEKLGAKSYILCCIKARYFMIPWNFWKNMKENTGRKYVKADDLTKYEVFLADGRKKWIEFLKPVFEDLSPLGLAI